MKKLVAGLMVAASLMSFGCSGRNAEFGVVDMRKVETEAVSLKTIREDANKQMSELQANAMKDLAGKTGEEAQKINGEYEAKARLIQSEAQNKFKSAVDSALNAVAKEKNLSAILYKDVVPSGGKDVTQDIIDKMK